MTFTWKSGAVFVVLVAAGFVLGSFGIQMINKAKTVPPAKTK